MTRKRYESPEAEIEKFYLVADVITTSGDDPLEGGGDSYDGNDEFDF